MKKQFKDLYIKAFATTATLFLTLGIAQPVFAAGENLPDGSGIKDWILKLVGNIVIIYLVVQLLRAFFTQRWGMLVGSLLGGVVMVWVVYYTDYFIGVLKNIVNVFNA